MLADQNVLTHLGDPAMEEAGLPHFNILGNNLNTYSPESVVIWPRCEVRQALVNILTDIAVEFIVSHGLAHIARGHIGLMAERTGMSTIAEFL